VVSIFKTKGQMEKGEEEKILISSVNDVGRASSNESGESV
jgi:hypothetical protein